MIHVYFSMVIPVSTVRCKVAGCGWSVKRPRRPRSGAADRRPAETGPAGRPAAERWRSNGHVLVILMVGGGYVQYM